MDEGWALGFDDGRNLLSCSLDTREVELGLVDGLVEEHESFTGIRAIGANVGKLDSGYIILAIRGEAGRILQQNESLEGDIVPDGGVQSS